MNFNTRPQQANMNSQKTIRVHINPNFNNSLPGDKANPKSQLSRMHVNPAFALQKVAAKITQDTKIYVNPNFISRPPRPCDISLHSAEPRDNLATQYSLVKHTKEQLLTQSNYATGASLSKSRYKLVRNKLNIPQKKNIAGSKEETKNLVKLTKYKSIRVNTSRNSFESIKATKSRVVKYTIPYLRKPEVNATTKQNLPSKASKLSKSIILRSKCLSKYKIVKKKPTTSLPCPLFVKYGKCLRQMRGRCLYVHDKKHVSICRNLLKGRCFDSDCRFSHELTSNRMPTCYFYLNGVCTKENCPYLHVKLNENASVCPDFQKGYCEKGEACIKLHLFTKRILRNKPSRPKSNIVIPEVKKEINNDVIQSVADGRYYTESDGNKSSDNVCEIKPTRCKLGDLPSFIQL